MTDTAKLKAAAERQKSILEYIASFEPADIDSDTVDLRFEDENGCDTGCDVSIVEECRRSADLVGELIAALEAKDAQIAELLEKQRLIDICQGQGLEHRIAAERRAEAAEKRVAELERQAIQPLPIGELISRLEEQTGEPWGEVYLAGINLRRGESDHG
ncbi:hypothetical protein [Cronobacter malonaticus]|uniref:hypothetical protein n=1 Tax=Cronobacter malonaticus TaxID=413503 RepID=UPI0028939094|nr:hypothetical protein [Cronobacter malonaticus]MDT3597010.1 hypothetical protein [Cronobacter malonaticus]